MKQQHRDPFLDYDPVAQAEKAIANNLDSVVFTKIDDRAIKKAPNWMEFCFGPDFLAMKPGPFPRQIQMATVFFGEYCPRCSKPGFIEDLFSEKLADIRENVKFLEHGVCPKCNVQQTELFKTGELREFDEFNLCAGMRSGKSTLTSMIAAYHLHRFLVLPDPARYYGLLENQTLHMTMVALTATQAEDSLWQCLLDRIAGAPWFKSYHQFLDDTCKQKGIAPVHHLKETFLWYDHKRLVLSFSGANIKTIRGRTRAFTAIDEVGWFDVNAENDGIKVNAMEQHKALEASLATVRTKAQKLRGQGANNVPTGIDCNISSPSSVTDAIMRLVRSASEKPSVCSYHFPTWMINPDMPKHLLKAADQKAFDRDFAAEPPLATSPFMSDEKLVERCVQAGRSNILGYRKMRECDPVDPTVETTWLQCIPAIRDKDTPRMLTIDAGATNNSFALTLLSLNVEKKTAQIDGVLECAPEKMPDGSAVPVNFARMFDQCILPIVEKLNIRMVVYDQWQSMDQIQRLRSDFRVRAESYSLRWEDMINIRSCWYDGRVSLPKPERDLREIRRSTKQVEELLRGVPVTHLLWQALTVREIGRRVAKPLNGTDDIFRAACLGIKFITDPDTSRLFMFSGAAGRGQPGRRVGAIQRNGTATRQGSSTGGRSIGIRRGLTDPYGLVGRGGPRGDG